MKNTPVTHLHPDRDFDLLTQFQIDGIKSLIFPYLFSSGLHDYSDIVLENLSWVEKTGNYSPNQIARMKVIAWLLHEGSEQTKNIIEWFVLSVNNTNILEDEFDPSLFIKPASEIIEETTKWTITFLNNKNKQ